MYIYIYVCIYIYTYIYIHTYIYICKCVCVCLCARGRGQREDLLPLFLSTALFGQFDGEASVGRAESLNLFPVHVLDSCFRHVLVFERHKREATRELRIQRRTQYTDKDTETDTDRHRHRHQHRHRYRDTHTSAARPRACIYIMIY